MCLFVSQKKYFSIHFLFTFSQGNTCGGYPKYELQKTSFNGLRECNSCRPTVNVNLGQLHNIMCFYFYLQDRDDISMLYLNSTFQRIVFHISPPTIEIAYLQIY